MKAFVLSWHLKKDREESTSLQAAGDVDDSDLLSQLASLFSLWKLLWASRIFGGGFGGGATLSPPSPQIVVILIKHNFLSIYNNQNIEKTLVFSTALRIRAQGGWGRRSIMNGRILVSRSRCNAWPRTKWLTAAVYSLTAQEARSLKSRCQQGCAPSRGSSGGPSSFLPAVNSSHQSVAWGSQTSSCFWLPSLFSSPLCVFLTEFVTGFGAHLANPRWCLLETFNLSSETLFSNMVEFGCSGRWTCFLGATSQPTRDSYSPPGKAKVAQSCLTLCDPIDCTVCASLQARILEWVAVPFSKGSSQPRSPELQEESLPSEPPGKPQGRY